MHSSLIHLDDHALEQFNLAQQKAFWRGLRSRLLRTCNCLRAFESELAHRHMQSQHDLGVRIVALDDIIGSAGRHRQFDRAFYPLQSHTTQRWLSILKAHLRQISLPPVELVQLDGTYFVMDGHHRLSVARTLGQQFVEAHIIAVNLAA